MAFKNEVVKIKNLALEHYLPDKEIKDKRILFVHSSGHGSWMWKNFLSYFAERGYDSWALNLRGHHLSDPVDDWEKVGVSEYLEDIAKAVDRVGGDVVLVGHSMSGLLILKYAESHRVAGLIVSQSGLPRSLMQEKGIEIKGPMPGKGQREIKSGAIVPMKDRALVEKMLFDKDNVEKESVDLVLKMLGEESARVGGEIMQMELVPEKIRAPLYVLGFDANKIGIKMPVDLNKVLAEELKARDYKVIEPGGHDYMLEKNWQEYAHQFEVWINSR
ncbi:MAG: alpha/beta hydrolase [Deltaproteobacteria bacterium]|nr:alpha/beta hydrolase [Deltaproteobacteria bacterium]